ncbi:MAG TPA: tetratricopeptide repeat protein [Thermoanaerobaculia bacterium]|jgi:tetratricopeptide (TPR) repeat protein
MSHYDDDVLSRFALDRSLVEDAESVAMHIEECGLCRAQVEAFRDLDDVMRSADTWKQADALMTRSARVDEALALKARLDAEDRAAERRLAPVLVSPIHFRDADIAEKPWAQNAGVVRHLCAAAHRLHEQRPEFSLLLVRTAYAIAERLENSPDVSRRFYLALALREGANACRYLGRFADALKALSDAEKLFDENPASDPHDVAIVWFIRATVFLELGQLDEGRSLARRAASVLRHYGDDLRELGALLVEGSCLTLAGNNVEAITVYGKVARHARSAGNRNILGRALQNTGIAALNLKQFSRAEESYVEALVLFDELGLVTEKARTEWSLALVAVYRGELEKGVEQLSKARGELRRLGLVNDHALATLDWASTRLALNESGGVAEACKEIMVRFESEGMMKNARFALAHVHEALARQTATPALLRQVRAYLEDLPTRPERVFIPAR